MKYKRFIQDGTHSVFVTVVDEYDNCVCHLNFNRKYIETLGNRYDKDGMTSNSSELDVILNQALCDVQDKLNLAKSLDTSS
jgi:hypothetical protein